MLGVLYCTAAPPVVPPGHPLFVTTVKTAVRLALLLVLLAVQTVCHVVLVHRYVYNLIQLDCIDARIMHRRPPCYRRRCHRRRRCHYRAPRQVYDFLASAGAKYGIGFWKPGSGIIHQVGEANEQHRVVGPSARRVSLVV